MKLQIIKNEALCAGIFRMRLTRKDMPKAYPGQFVHIRCSDSCDPLLRRPFSIAGMNGQTFEILYKVVGKGTSLLSEKSPGGILDVAGPLGNGFSVETLPEAPVLVAGGMGIAPMLFLAGELPGGAAKFILGAGTGELLLCREELENAGVELLTSTDDGTCGVKGDVCSVLSSVLPENPCSVVCACGPYEMLRSVYSISKKYGVPSRLCFETPMACGVGACLGCVISTRGEAGQAYKRVCRDGPVFDGDIIAWQNRQ